MNWDSLLVAFFNQGLAHPFWDGVMVVVSAGSLPLSALGSLILQLTGKRREGFALLVALIFSVLLAVGLQFLFMRPRPVGIRVVQPASVFPSFPSGHAAATSAGALLVSLFWRRAGLLALLWAVLASLSRVYLGQHYPSDLLGGAILGVAVATAVYGCWYRPADITRPGWAWLLWSQLAVVLLASLTACLGLLRFNLLTLPGVDKLFHFLLPGGVAFLATRWQMGRPSGTLLVVLGLLATAEEALQTLSPARSFDLLDLAAALVGIFVLGRMGAAMGTAALEGIGDTCDKIVDSTGGG